MPNLFDITASLAKSEFSFCVPRIDRRQILTCLYGCVILAVGGFATGFAVANERLVHFDTPSIVAVHPVAQPSQLPDVSHASIRWCIPIELSSFIASPNAPRIDQMIVEVELLDANIVVDDYMPRTSLASPMSSDISVERSKEANNRMGFTAVGNYGPTLRGDLGGDLSSKELNSYKFQQVAPMEIVSAAGTLHRSRGVYFKLKSTATQVLEGDKAFQIIVRSDARWRGGLLKIRARAQAARRGFPGMPNEDVLLGDQQFLVAVYGANDKEAYRLASNLVAAEEALRASAERYRDVIRKRTGRNVFQQVAAKLDLTPELIPVDWMQIALFDSVDPHADPSIRRLPVDVRVALLDFQEARETFITQAVTKSLDEELASH
jgi:hypothetical protein